ncbi:MAG TPA: BLUF domain-containing protein [Bacteroidales bacterium]|nr:BLUF domain-containing protein [Bacteroidales bacterium]
MQELIHIVYVSFSSTNLSEEDLESLLKEIRIKNKEQQITGLLLYNSESFIQVIEGPKDNIHNLFEIISNDSRHVGIVKILEETIKTRSFPDWSMGYRRFSDKESKQIPGFSNFMNSRNPENIEGSTHKVIFLLNSFKVYS